MINLIIYIVLALLLGVIAGTITGLIPGIHVNLLALGLLGISGFLLNYIDVKVLGVFIVAMAITHTFLDFIPSIFLGAPDEDTVLSILPGHDLLNKGEGYKAIILTLYGSALGLIIILIATPIFMFILPKIYIYLQKVMFFILLIASCYLIFREKLKLKAGLVFLIAGFLGLAVFNLELKNSLLPLLTGLFGGSSLIISFFRAGKIPKQKTEKFKKIKVKGKTLLNSGIAAFLSAPLCCFLPSLGAGQAAVIGSDIIGGKSKEEFLILLGAINTIVAGLAFVVLYAVNETRTGLAVSMSQLTEISLGFLILILSIVILAGVAGFFLTIFISKFMAKNIFKIDYKYLSLIVFGFLILLVFAFSGILGVLVFLISASTGIFGILSKVRRTQLMGSLMLTSLVLYLPFL